MTKYERINVAIPVKNEWNLSNLEEKAVDCGMDKNKFVMLFNFARKLNFDREDQAG